MALDAMEIDEIRIKRSIAKNVYVKPETSDRSKERLPTTTPPDLNKKQYLE
jgi:hypothetical protein